MDSVLELNNGVRIPVLGLGTYKSHPDVTGEAVAAGIAAGYRLVDAAAAYGNEAAVGEGISGSGIARDELFVTTKLWIADYGYHAALAGFDASLTRLGLDFVDLYLLHWPAPSGFEETVAAYRAMESLLRVGLVRAIGVCNFTPDQLEALIARTNVVPAVNQIELHPWFNQSTTRLANTRLGVVTQSWSPIGGIFINHPADPDNIRIPIEDTVIVDLAAKYGKSPAQIAIRWHLQHGLSAIPKSVNPNRLTENIDVFDFTLTDTDMAAIDGMETGQRGGGDPEVFDLALLAARAKLARRAELDRNRG